MEIKILRHGGLKFGPPERENFSLFKPVFQVFFNSTFRAMSGVFIRIQVLLAMLMVFSFNHLHGQCGTPPNCITNSGMDFGSSTTIGNPIGTNLPDWNVFLGNPLYAEGTGGSRAIQLNNSDGVFACYNFRAGRKYRVCFRGYNPNTVSSGSIVVEAHDGSSGQTIASIAFYNPSLTSPRSMLEQTLTFTPSSNFSQLRFLIPNLGNSYSVVIDDVGVLEVPDVTVTPGTINGCGVATLTANSANTLNLTWTPATNLSSTNASTVYASPCQTTSYALTYTAVGCNHYTCTSGTEQVTVNVSPGVSVMASPSSISTCASSTLTATSVNPMTVNWTPTLALAPTSGNTVVAKPCRTTTYVATFSCALNGCQYARPVTVNVQQNGSIINRTAKPCGSPIDLEYVSGMPCPGATYKWYAQSAPGTLLSTSSKYIKPVSSSTDQGVYYVIVTTPNKCNDTSYATVVMDCCKMLADFDIVDCNPVRFVNATVDSIGGDTILNGQWHWDFGDGTTSSIRNPSHLYTSLFGKTTVCLTAVVEQNGSTCCAKVCREFDICDFGCVPKAAFDYSLVTPGTTDVQFTDKSVGGGAPCGYEWRVNGVLITSATGNPNPLITLGPPLPPGPGNKYHVCLKVWYCPIPGTTCFEEWCEVIEIP